MNELSDAPFWTVEFEPVYSVLNSMTLLHEVEQWPAVDAWIVRTAAELSVAQQQRYALIFGPLRGALLIEGDWQDFPAYLAALAEQPSASMQQRAAAWLAADAVPAAVLAEARVLLGQPALLQAQVVAHLRDLWQQYFAAEWQRTSAALATQAQYLQQSLAEPGVAAKLNAWIGAEVWQDRAIMTSNIRQVVYSNSPHNGRYLTWLRSDTTLHMFFAVQRSIAAITRTTQVGHAELAGRLAALADETRLQLLALFHHHDTLTAQAIMAQLDLTQSAVSRQLRPLLPFLQESRGKGANKHYSFSPTQLELTFQAVRDTIQGRNEPAADARLGFAAPLRSYLDRQGKLTMLPIRRQDRQAALAMIAEQIAPDRDYTEKEVNALIESQIAYDDFATIRRELYNSRYLNREPDGSRYWKGERE